MALLLTLPACGGGGNGESSVPAASAGIGTLAYVLTECRDTPEGFFERQSLHILHDDRDVTVMETPAVGPVAELAGLCVGKTFLRFGLGSISRDAFQDVTVSPDGADVVFEVTDDFSVNPPLPLHLPPQQKGIFFVRADGSGLRSLGPPSRLPLYIIENGNAVGLLDTFAFSPDSRMITFADTGPDGTGNDAAQVVTLDVVSGQRRQITHLPPGVPPADLPSLPGVLSPAFIDSQTIGFFTNANPDGLFEGYFRPFTVHRDGAGLPRPAAIPVVAPDSQIVFTFAITGKPIATRRGLPGQPKNNIPRRPYINELFAGDGPNLLQLTNFQRSDTGDIAVVGVDQQTVFFSASADPFGANPTENCQIFSIDRNGDDLRQLTRFRESGHATFGCDFAARGFGCTPFSLTQDSQSRRLVFYSSCDPLGTNPNGDQVFAMRPDGSDLLQLTHARGLKNQSGGTVLGELPGPIAYGPYAP
jgi:hypothetical protein